MDYIKDFRKNDATTEQGCAMHLGNDEWARLGL